MHEAWLRVFFTLKRVRKTTKSLTECTSSSSPSGSRAFNSSRSVSPSPLVSAGKDYLGRQRKKPSQTLAQLAPRRGDGSERYIASRRFSEKPRSFGSHGRRPYEASTGRTTSVSFVLIRGCLSREGVAIGLDPSVSHGPDTPRFINSLPSPPRPNSTRIAHKHQASKTPVAGFTDEATQIRYNTAAESWCGLTYLYHRGAKAGMLEAVYRPQRRERGAEGLAAPLETFREEKQLLGVRHLGLLKIRVGLQPELCRQPLYIPHARICNNFVAKASGMNAIPWAGVVKQSMRPNWWLASVVKVKLRCGECTKKRFRGTARRAPRSVRQKTRLLSEEALFIMISAKKNLGSLL